MGVILLCVTKVKSSWICKISNLSFSSSFIAKQSNRHNEIIASLTPLQAKRACDTDSQSYCVSLLATHAAGTQIENSTRNVTSG